MPLADVVRSVLVAVCVAFVARAVRTRFRSTQSRVQTSVAPRNRSVCRAQALATVSPPQAGVHEHLLATARDRRGICPFSSAAHTAIIGIQPWPDDHRQRCRAAQCQPAFTCFPGITSPGSFVRKVRKERIHSRCLVRGRLAAETRTMTAPFARRPDPSPALHLQFCHAGHATQISHVLTHSTGLQHVFPDRPTFDTVCDWDNVRSVMEEAKPAWPPGSRASYHYFTFGWLVAAIVEKVSGVPFAEVRDGRRPLRTLSVDARVRDGDVAIGRQSLRRNVDGDGDGDGDARRKCAVAFHRCDDER